VRQAHQIVVSAHNVPVLGEEVLVGVALVLFDQEITLDASAIAGGEVAALMHIRGIERAAGKPSMFGCLIVFQINKLTYMARRLCLPQYVIFSSRR
jgi:hypothetical protein